MRWSISWIPCVLLVACAAPEVTRLEEAPRVAASRPGLEGANLDAGALGVEALELRGVRGGAITLLLDGSPGEVVAMLLDYEGADGHRAWARSYRLLSRTPDEVHAEWSFEGKMGVDPTVELVFRRLEGGDPLVVDYELTKTAFGLAAFFGDYRVFEVPEHPGRSLLVERVFIDSGLFFVNASAEDIAAGLREDAHLMREWMRARLQGQV